MNSGQTIPRHASQPPAAAAALAKSYTPAEAEPSIRERWDQAKAFHADPYSPAAPFCILIPPPNVTAALHLGHALNNTLQDVLVRFHRMRGFNTLWMPGTDHAGIATQAVVEKRLLLQGKRRTDFSREQFIAKVQEWKDEYEATIIEQLKAMGCSCDFQRTRFTMDEVCAKAVREAFFLLFKDGLIYRGKRLVNWDPVSQTALADDEVEMEEVQGHMYYLRYPLCEPDRVDHREPDRVDPVSRGDTPRLAEFITVATTRPETMLGDTAVAINPKDPRAANLVGKKLRLPIVNREIPIVADDYVVLPRSMGGDPSDPKSEFATGFLKVTPGHDPNDYEIGQRHQLPIINVMAPDASISDKHGWTDVSSDAQQLVGLSREEARKKVVEWFEQHGLLENVKPYTHSVGHSYRSHVPIEPYLSDQWYVKVTDDRMRGEALRALAREQFSEPDRVDHSEPDRVDRSEPDRVDPVLLDAPGRNALARPGDNELRFYPARYAKTFQQWHENLRDWCISRQLWWGHRIPVWTGEFPANWTNDGIWEELEYWSAHGRIWAFGRGAEEGEWLNESDSRTFVCLRENQDRAQDIIDFLESYGFNQDPDVLDTWFSSGLWPISTMGWPEPEAFPNEIPEGSALIEKFNPSSVLCTAREIITLWVSRMVMFNRYLRDGKLPFKDVFIHAMIQDGYGQKMSKSLGNGVDPRDIIHSHGADAMRFVLVQMTTNTQDVRLPVDSVCPHCATVFQPKEITSPAGYRVAAPVQDCPKCSKPMVSGYGAASGLATSSKDQPQARNTSSKFDLGRNFANKLWNATRFALSNLDSSKAQGFQSLGAQDLPLVDKWIIARLHRTLHTIEDALFEYQFNVYADAMYDFIWRDFCDWYLEAIKPTVRSNPRQQQVLATVLNAALRLLHPIMPFVTETLFPHVNAYAIASVDGIRLGESELLASAPWPDIKCSVEDKTAVATFERVQNLVNAIRTLRAERQVPPKRMISLAAPSAVLDLIEASRGVVQALTGLKDVKREEAGGKRPAGGIALAFEGCEVILSDLVDAVNESAERTRLQKVITEKERAIAGFQSKLSNQGYISKAPPDKVEETSRLLSQAQADLAAAASALRSLGD